VTGEVWIGLKQNIIDTAVNEGEKRLHACVRTVAHCSRKQNSWMNCQP